MNLLLPYYLICNWNNINKVAFYEIVLNFLQETKFIIADWKNKKQKLSGLSEKRWRYTIRITTTSLYYEINGSCSICRKARLFVFLIFKDTAAESLRNQRNNLSREWFNCVKMSGI